ncbi:MAG: DUF1987 domain-containing protein, partial [SAR324 cluster bacterium]|nr:DUF1987 domain-containing protein [SAR324 cluster bacterium]
KSRKSQLFSTTRICNLFHPYLQDAKYKIKVPILWSDRMQLEATNRTPAVSISATGIEMKGECYPEDITAFAEPVMEALRQQLESAESFHARIELYYFNSSSAKFLFDFFEDLEEAAEDGKQIQIDWCYRADDSSMQEAGEDFEEDFENAQYQLVEI